MLDSSLRLEGDDGAEHRAVIAPWIAFLRHAMSDWTEANRSLMFGPEAPEGLAQPMIDNAIRWGQPNGWLLENHREMVHDAVERGINNALDHLLVAMLRELPGYSVQDIVGLVGRTSEMMSAAGDRLGRLLSRSNTEHGSSRSRRQLLAGRPRQGAPTRRGGQRRSTGLWLVLRSPTGRPRRLGTHDTADHPNR